MGWGHSHLPAPVASVLQSPKDAPLEFFQDSTRPLSARMSDRPGGAFSGLRPTSFSRGSRPARSRVSSITEEEQTGDQPLVSQSYSEGFGRSESSIGGGEKGSGGGDRPIASRRIAGSRSGDREGRGRSSRGDKDGRRRRSSRSRSTSRGGKGAASASASSGTSGASTATARSSAVVSGGDGTDGSGSGKSGIGKSGKSRSNNGGFGDLSGVDTSDEAPPPNRTQMMYRNHAQCSVGTALHAIDRVQPISASKNQKPGAGAAAAVAASKVTTSRTPGRRRASHSGPVGTNRRVSPTANGELADSAVQDESGGGGGTMLPRRTSTGQLRSLVSMGSNYESVTTIGTPGISQDTTMSRGLSRASRGNGGLGRSRYVCAMYLSMRCTLRTCCFINLLSLCGAY